MEHSIEDLVGAMLDDVTVDWRNGIVLITFLDAPKLGGSGGAVRANDFVRVEVPRGGASAARRVKAAARNGGAVEITMESGETLRVHSASFAVDALGG